MAGRRRVGIGAILLLIGLSPAPARAEVTHFEILSREAQPGGELITARATISVDPANPHDARIADIALAPRNAAGRVEATADVTILRPPHPNGTLIVDLPNRGHALAAAYLERDQPGYLARHGVTAVEVAWQGDLAEGIALHPPVITGLTGRSRDTWVMTDDKPVVRLTLAYPAAADPQARISLRRHPEAQAEAPSGFSVRFVDSQTVEVTRPAGAATAGSVVELIYTATDPRVMGLGFAAVRDVTAFLKHAQGPGNPLADLPRRRAIGFGISQSGRALRDFLYQGFNADEAGGQVFDGMMPIIPGARRSFTNARFAQPGRNPGPIADRLYAVDQFPFAYETASDRLTGRRDGLLQACRASHTCPRIIEVDSEFEFWGSHASLNITDPQGAALPVAPEARLFMVAGSQHGPDPTSRHLAQCRQPSSPVAHAPVVRALAVAMDAWIETGQSPPASRYPSVADGTLVAAERVYAQPIPALGYAAHFAKAPLVQEGPDGPAAKAWYPLRLPRADATGNAVGGVRLPLVSAPRASYTGWNPQVAYDGPENLCTQVGGAVPLAATPAEAAAAHDPRPSLTELYPSQARYVAAVRAAADALVGERLLLAEDAAAEVRAAETGDLARLAP
jgi:Alpha/beta hydrolase domain